MYEKKKGIQKKTHFAHCQGRRSVECRVHIIIIVDCMCLCNAHRE